ncbi:MAG: hypothetical protein ACOC9A_01230 [Candidatus Bipolaricaulota bacterium]
MKKIFHLLYRPENLRLRDKIQTRTVEQTASKISQVLRQGVKEGTLDTTYPEEASRLIIRMGTDLQEETADVLLDPDAEIDGDEFARKYKAYENAIERVIGAPEGSVDLLGESDLEKILTYMGRGNEEKIRSE